MQCPNDNTTLVMSERQGIEIDYCPQCRGVWLDRGELDKIIERSTDAGPANAPREQYQQPRPEPSHHSEPRYAEPGYHDRPDNRHHDSHQHKKHHKESFLGDLFDF